MKVSVKKGLHKNNTLISVHATFPQYYGVYEYETATNAEFERYPSSWARSYQEDNLQKSLIQNTMEKTILEEIIFKMKKDFNADMIYKFNQQFRSMAHKNANLVFDINTGAVSFSTTMEFEFIRDTTGLSTCIKEACKRVIFFARHRYYHRLRQQKRAEIRRNQATLRKYNETLNKMLENAV